MYCIQVQKDTEKAIKNYEARFEKVVRKIENMVIKVEN